jgi:tRNA pseudouridine38-40 synthase
MARYKIILAYDGTYFLGSQRQATSRTVQGELEKALSRLGWEGKTVYLAGRTDTGTHASGQVAAFDLDWHHSANQLQKALNTLLPYDIAARKIEVVPEGFHPRFDARLRHYQYRLFIAEVRDPLRERYAWRVWPGVLDLTPLATIWTGTHDFYAFGTPLRTKGSTLRTVLSAKWQNQGDEWTFDIIANAFLYRMVRRLVYVQVAVGQGRLTTGTLVHALGTRSGSTRKVDKPDQPRIPANLAPASGLTLVEVFYDNFIQ